MTILNILRVRSSQGSQFIRDIRTATPAGFHGLPVIREGACADGCAACHDVCPTRAIALEPLELDLGRCVFCNQCAEVCPEGRIELTPETKMGASVRADLVRGVGKAEAMRVRASAGFAKIFGRSIKLRQVSAGGCNACELELNATANVNFDAQRFGIDWVASPRHADALVITGPLTKNMKDAVQIAWEAMPEPRFLVAVGACAISGGLHEGGAGVDREFLESVGPALFVPGCPPHPLTFVNALLDFLGIE